MSKFKILVPILFSFIMAAGYGLFVRLAFGSDQLAALYGTISVGFLFFVPLAVGVATQFFAPAQYRTNWLYAAFAPWAPCFIFSGLAIAFTWEAWICVVMALPIFFVMATGGGRQFLPDGPDSRGSRSWMWPAAPASWLELRPAGLGRPGPCPARRHLTLTALLSIYSSVTLLCLPQPMQNPNIVATHFAETYQRKNFSI